MELHLVQNRKENCHHDHIPINLKGNGNIVFSVHDARALEEIRYQHNSFKRSPNILGNEHLSAVILIGKAGHFYQFTFGNGSINEDVNNLFERIVFGKKICCSVTTLTVSDDVRSNTRKNQFLCSDSC